MKVPIEKIPELDHLMSSVDYNELVNVDSDHLTKIIFEGNFCQVDDAGPSSPFMGTIHSSEVLPLSPVQDQDNMDSRAKTPKDVDPPEISDEELLILNDGILPLMDDDHHIQLFFQTLEENFTETELDQLLFSCNSHMDTATSVDAMLTFLYDSTESTAVEASVDEISPVSIVESTPVITSVDVLPFSSSTEISPELKSECQKSSALSYKILTCNTKLPVFVHKNKQLPTLLVSVYRLSPDDIAKLKDDLKINSNNDSKRMTRQRRKRSTCQENLKKVGESKRKRKTESLEDLYSFRGASGGPLVENFQRINNATPAAVIKGHGRLVNSEPRKNQSLMDQTTPIIQRKRGRPRRVSLDLQSMTPVCIPPQKLTPVSVPPQKLMAIRRYNLRAKEN